MIEQKPAEIPDEEWQQISPTTRVFIVQLVKRNQELEARLRDLEERVGQNSRNSSRPPSSDRAEQNEKKQRSQRQKSQRKRGGQPGHQRQIRLLKPVEQVNKVVAVKPERCRH